MKCVNYINLKCEWVIMKVSRSLMSPSFREKFLGLIVQQPVPRTDTGGQGEYPKVSERTMVKELGKMTP